MHRVHGKSSRSAARCSQVRARSSFESDTAWLLLGSLSSISPTWVLPNSICSSLAGCESLLQMAGEPVAHRS